MYESVYSFESLVRLEGAKKQSVVHTHYYCVMYSQRGGTFARRGHVYGLLRERRWDLYVRAERGEREREGKHPREGGLD